MFNFTDHSHRRFNPLINTYVLCSPHRAKRPWQGAEEQPHQSEMPVYDPKCYLCPGNARATGGQSNPKYESTYVFPNDFPAVQMEQPELKESQIIQEGDSDEVQQLKKRLLHVKSVQGNCFVICFSPNHSLTLPLMEVKDIEQVVATWQQLYEDVQRQRAEQKTPFQYLQIFENKGLAMGCSNPHPHGQAWCLDVVPTELQHEFDNMGAYHRTHGSHMLGDYVKLELAAKTRVVVVNDSFVAVVPYWALWPFETLVLAREHVASLLEFTDKHRRDLALLLKQLTTKYDNLFRTSFPYSMGLHQAKLGATREERDAAWFHMHFYPPLLRSATVRKFFVGFEMLGEAQRDLTSEQAAARLQAIDGDVHYSQCQ